MKTPKSSKSKLKVLNNFKKYQNETATFKIKDEKEQK